MNSWIQILLSSFIKVKPDESPAAPTSFFGWGNQRVTSGHRRHGGDTDAVVQEVVEKLLTTSEVRGGPEGLGFFNRNQVSL